MRLRPPKDFKKPDRRNNSVNRKRLALLERRRDYLEERIMIGEGELPAENDAEEETAKKSLSYNRVEFQALTWGIGIIREWMDDDPLFDVVWSGTPFTDRANDQDVLDLMGTEGSYLGERVELVGMQRADEVNDRPAFKLTLRPLEDGEKASRGMQRWGGVRRPLKIDASFESDSDEAA